MLNLQLLPQRQRLRQLILRQQQQKSAIRQEKGLQEVNAATSASSTPSLAKPQHWPLDDPTVPQQQADLFGRPPPPYPGTMRAGIGPPHPPGGGVRFPGTFLSDQQRPFINEGQFPRQQFSRDVSGMATMGNMVMRPQGMR